MPDTPQQHGLEGPRCPKCGRPLVVTLRYRQVAAAGSTPSEPSIAVVVIFCGACGTTLTTSAQSVHIPTEHPPVELIGEAGVDESSLSGLFQRRCGELIAQIQSLGFNPGDWIGLISHLGAVVTAKQLLSQRRVLEVTSWLVENGHPELTLESEIGELRWADLFTDRERDEAKRRLSTLGEH